MVLLASVMECFVEMGILAMSSDVCSTQGSVSLTPRLSGHIDRVTEVFRERPAPPGFPPP